MTSRRADGGRTDGEAGTAGDAGTADVEPPAANPDGGSPSGGRGPDPATGDTAALFRRVGLLHLGAAGAVNLAVGVAVLLLATGDTLLRWTVDVAARYVTAQTLLRDAPAYVDVATRLLPALGVLAVAVGALAVVVAYRARSSGGVRAPVLAAVGVALNPLALPLAGIAVALVVLADRERGRRVVEPAEA